MPPPELKRECPKCQGSGMGDDGACAWCCGRGFHTNRDALMNVCERCEGRGILNFVAVDYAAVLGQPPAKVDTWCPSCRGYGVTGIKPEILQGLCRLRASFQGIIDALRSCINGARELGLSLTDLAPPNDPDFDGLRGPSIACSLRAINEEKETEE